MSLFGSLMAGFDEDPFFGGHRSMMRHMDQMMSTMLRDPFEADPFFGGSPFPALAHHPAQAALTHPHPPQAALTHPHTPQGALTHPHTPQGRHQRARPRDPFSALAIPSMSNLMTSIQDQMAQQGNCHTFSSSSVMTMTTGPDGRPTVYQASSSSRAAPGGVRETRRTVHDGHSGTRKMAIGHHIGERAHIIERENANGAMEERQEFVNLEEEEADQFNQEFRHRTQGGVDSSSIDYRPRHRNSNSSHRPRTSNLPALTSSSYRRRSRPMLSITAGPSEDRGRRDREERRQRFK